MKKIGLSIAAVVLSASVGFAQGKAPSEVQKTLKEKFPDAKSVKWEKESDGGWEAEFSMNGNETSVEFDSKGIWKQTETEIEAMVKLFTKWTLKKAKRRWKYYLPQMALC